MTETRTCTICKATLPLSAFRFENKAKGRRKARCGDCENARMRADRKVNGEQRRKQGRESYARRAVTVYRNNLKRKFGLTDEQAEWVAAAHVCDLCGSDRGERKLVVDHCHATGSNRGVLCSNCNVALGQFKDDPALMRRAADYIERGGSGFFSTESRNAGKQT